MVSNAHASDSTRGGNGLWARQKAEACYCKPQVPPTGVVNSTHLRQEPRSGASEASDATPTAFTVLHCVDPLQEYASMRRLDNAKL